MKKNLKPMPRPNSYCLGHPIRAVGSCSKNDRETVSAVAHLLASGRVRITRQGRLLRAQVC